jgi:hypothetical protein
MAIGEYIDDGNPDGSVFGRSTGKIGFFGLATPIVKATVTLTSTAGTTTPATIAADLVAVKAALTNLGLM